MMSSHTTVEQGGGEETVTCESRSMKTNKTSTARWSDQTQGKGPNPNKPRRYRKRKNKGKENPNCYQGTIRTGPLDREKKPKSLRNKAQEGDNAQRSAPPKMLSGFMSPGQEAPALEALGPFGKGSQPTKKGNKDSPKGIHKVENPREERDKMRNVDFPLIPPSGIGYRSCATFVRDKPQRDKESKDMERSTRKTKPRRKDFRNRRNLYEAAGIQLDNKPASFILNLASGDVEHQYYDIKRQKWVVGHLDHDKVTVEIQVDTEMYKHAGQATNPDLRKTNPLEIKERAPKLKYHCVVDTGAQLTCMGKSHAKMLGIDTAKLEKVENSATSISGDKIHPLGSFFSTISGLTKSGKLITTKEIVYVFEKTPTIYLSRTVLITLGVIRRAMNIGDFCAAAANILREGPQQCTEVRDNEGRRLCGCPERSLVPDPPEWEKGWTEENIPEMKRKMLAHYAASAFNICKLQQQSRMDKFPPVILHVDEEKYKPKQHTQAATVPIHLQHAVANSIEVDRIAGVIENVPSPENNRKWGVARMVIVPKPTPPGEPPKIRRTIDYKWLNAHISPSTWHNSPPLQQAEGVDKDGYKTVLDARDGFHSIPLAEESRKWTQFMRNQRA